MALNQKQTVKTYTAAGAITLRQGVVDIVGSGVVALTLPPPSAIDEGSTLIIIAGSAHAHTVTYTAGFNGGGTSTDVATFGGAIGDNLEVVALKGVWRVVSLRNVTLG